MPILIRSTTEGPAVIPVDGLPCGVSGLAITRAQGADGYAITHVRSGFCVLWFPDTDPEGILAAALELAPLTDWTVSGADIPRREIGPQVRAISRDYGAQLYRADRQGDPEDIQ